MRRPIFNTVFRSHYTISIRPVSVPADCQKIMEWIRASNANLLEPVATIQELDASLQKIRISDAAHAFIVFDSDKAFLLMEIHNACNHPLRVVVNAGPGDFLANAVFG